jgi:hypothetical protein
MVCDRRSRPPSSSSFSNSFNEEVMKGDSCGGCERRWSTCLGAAVVVAAGEEEVVVVVVVCSITMTMTTLLCTHILQQFFRTQQYVRLNTLHALTIHLYQLPLQRRILALFQREPALKCYKKANTTDNPCKYPQSTRTCHAPRSF